MSRPRSFDAPPNTGLMAEAIAMYYLGKNARWIGGRNQGHDILLGGSRIDVKSGVLKPSRILSRGGPSQPAIGIHLNTGGLAKLKTRKVDEILVVTRDPSQGDDGSSNRMATAQAMTKAKNTTVHVSLEITTHGVAVYRLGVPDVLTVFDRPFNTKGDQLKTPENVEAAVTDLQQFRIQPPR